MANSIKLSGPQSGDRFFLGEVEVGQEPDAAFRFIGKNTSDTTLRRVFVGVEGAGAENVELAHEVDHGPAEFSANVIMAAEVLEPDVEFSFWARVRPPSSEENVGSQEFEFVVRSTSIA